MKKKEFMTKYRDLKDASIFFKREPLRKVIAIVISSINEVDSYDIIAKCYRKRGETIDEFEDRAHQERLKYRIWEADLNRIRKKEEAKLIKLQEAKTAINFFLKKIPTGLLFKAMNDLGWVYVNDQGHESDNQQTEGERDAYTPLI